MTATHRVVQWTTGNVARQTVRAVLARPDLELVGVYAFSGDKVGKVHAIGMRITGLPVVNAIRAVCAAPPGIRTYADLPPVSAHLG